MSYKKKSEIELVWDDNKAAVQAQWKLVLGRIQRRGINVLMDKAYQEFQEGLDRGELIQIGPSTQEAVQLVAQVLQQIALDAQSETIVRQLVESDGTYDG